MDINFVIGFILSFFLVSIIQGGIFQFFISLIVLGVVGLGTFYYPYLLIASIWLSKYIAMSLLVGTVVFGTIGVSSIFRDTVKKAK